MVKQITLFTVLITGLLITPAQVSSQDSLLASACGSGEYTISAYYSPVPGQVKYATGSYAGDIRLNGGGVMTASGTSVESAKGGFVAAPPCLPFGTKLEIAGMGTLVVLDRGGAIQGRRLDVWMGYGDVALQNALHWGKRRAFVNIYGIDSEIAVNYDFDNAFSTLASFQKVHGSDPLNFVKELNLGDSGEDVARLQQILKDLAFFDGKVNGVFDANTSEAVKLFQADAGLLKNPDLDKTGKFGFLTLASLKQAVTQSREKFIKELPSRNLGRGATGDDVKKLQDILVKLGYLKSVTGVYDTKTVNAVYKFQRDEGLVANDNDSGAGYFGPNTQIALDKVALKIENAISTDLKKVAQADSNSTLEFVNASDIITSALKEGDSGKEVVMLQKILKDLNYLRIEPTGYFGPVTTHAVFKFQQRMNLVSSNNDAASGYVGPETRKALNTFLNSKGQFIASVTNNSSLIASANVSQVQASRVLKFGDKGAEVRNLQKFLKSQGYFASAFTSEYFGEVTKNSLAQFQIDNNLVSDVSDPNAGQLDSQTINLMNSIM